MTFSHAASALGAATLLLFAAPAFAVSKTEPAVSSDLQTASDDQRVAQRDDRRDGRRGWDDRRGRDDRRGGDRRPGWGGPGWGGPGWGGHRPGPGWGGGHWRPPPPPVQFGWACQTRFGTFRLNYAQQLGAYCSIPTIYGAYTGFVVR